MATEIVIGCDSGTRAVKAVAMTMSGELVATAVEPHRGVRITADGGAEHDAAGLYRAIDRARRFSAPTRGLAVDRRLRRAYARMYEDQYRPLADGALR